MKKEENALLNQINSIILSKENLLNAGEVTKIHTQTAQNLSNYNTMRGGKEGFKGFVFEELHAEKAKVSGQNITILDNNKIADFQIKYKNGHISKAQAKMGYKGQNVDWSKYQGQKIIIDKGNTELIKSAKSAGMNVIESDVGFRESSTLAKNMQTESKILKTSNSKIVPKAHATGKIIKNCHNNGLQAAKHGAAFGGGFSLGSNVVQLAKGNISGGEAVKEISKDTVVAAGVSYVVGGVGTAIASTSAGAAVSGVVAATGTAIATSAAGTAVASTVIGATMIAAAPVVIPLAVAGAVLGGIISFFRN